MDENRKEHTSREREKGRAKYCKLTQVLFQDTSLFTASCFIIFYTFSLFLLSLDLSHDHHHFLPESSSFSFQVKKKKFLMEWNGKKKSQERLEKEMYER